MNYPCVLKPTFLAASLGVIRVNDKQEFVHAFHEIHQLLTKPEIRDKGKDRAKEILVEEYIPGDEFALEGLMVEGDLKVLALFDKPDSLTGPYFPETFYITPTSLSNDQQHGIHKTTQAAANAIGLIDGPIHAELRTNYNGIWPIEIAARSIGGLCSRVLRFSGNMSLEEIIIRHSLGRDVTSVSQQNEARGVLMLHVAKAGILQEIRGLENAKEICEIEEIVITIPIEQNVEPLPQGARYIGFIFAKAETSLKVIEALRQAYGCLEIIIK